MGDSDKRWWFVLGVALPLLLALLVGIDTLWDLRNYHLYVPHAWLHGRIAIDLAPAQLQSFHNPLLDTPYYLIVSSGLNPRWANLWLALPVVAAMLCLLWLQRTLSEEAPSRASQVVLALLALTGAATYSTFATTTNDAFVAAALLGALTLVVSTQPGEGEGRWFWAGLLAGTVAGLKLTALTYCIALAAAALAYGSWHWRQRALRLGRLAAGGALGFALSYAWWGWSLQQRFGNPFFPYFNNIFHSPFALPDPHADARFRPDSLLDGLLGPVHLLGRGTRFSELPLSDPRLLLGLLSLIALCWLARRRGAPDLRRARLNLLLAFVVSGWLLWQFQYGIYRYAMPLELLGVLTLVLLLQSLPRWRSAALLLALLLVSADTKRPNWGRVAAAPARFGIPTLPVSADALVVIGTQDPLAYLALGLPDAVPLASFNSNLLSPPACTGLQRRAVGMLARHEGPIWVLAAGAQPREEDRRFVRERFGLETSPPDCRPLDSAFGPASMCRARKLEPGRMCAASDDVRAPRLTVRAVPPAACGEAGESRVEWTLPNASTTSGKYQVWVAAPIAKDEWQLFAEGGAAGSSPTGLWDRPGTRYELKEAGSGRVLARATSDRRECVEAAAP